MSSTTMNTLSSAAGSAMRNAFLLLVLLAAIGGIYLLFKRHCFFLADDEQLVIHKLSSTIVINGPGVHMAPLMIKKAYKRNAELLEKLDFARLRTLSLARSRCTSARSSSSSARSTWCSPTPGAVALTHPVCGRRGQVDGREAHREGPKIVFPSSPHEQVHHAQTAISLESSQYVRLIDSFSGKRWVVQGETLLFLQPTWSIQDGVQEAIALKRTEYVRLIDSVSGSIRVEKGEQMLVPTATEAPLDKDVAASDDGSGKLTAINLKAFEYVNCSTRATGVLRVVRGEATVFLGPTEQLVDRKGKQSAVEIDVETAVAVRNKKTGALRLVTERGLYFPSAEDEIQSVQRLVKLADYECMIVSNESGELSFFYGDDAKRGDKPRAFFIPPHHSPYTLTWSRGRRRERRDLVIERIDTRPQFMSFEFNCRTSDNVELVLEGTFFWQVVDVETMVKVTGDTTGDMSSHARSRFIQLVSKVTLKEFMNRFNDLASQAHRNDDEFYANRGVKIHTLEVTAYRCQDASTAKNLEQIIQETTNRMNRLSKQESENEIKLFAMKGEIDHETKRADLLRVLQDHKLLEARNEGEAEAERVRAFLAATAEAVPDLGERVKLWGILRKHDALAAVSSGPARLYFTPNDVNLSIETKEETPMPTPARRDQHGRVDVGREHYQPRRLLSERGCARERRNSKERELQALIRRRVRRVDVMWQ